LHLVLVRKVRRAKPDLKGSKEPQDHLGRQDPQAKRDQKATRDPKVLAVLPAHLAQRFVW
jgi:hypothetical protein